MNSNEHSRNLSVDDEPNSLQENLDDNISSNSSRDQYGKDINDILNSESDEFDIQPNFS